LIMNQRSVSSYDDLTKDCEQIDMLCEKYTWRSRDTRTHRDRQRQTERFQFIAGVWIKEQTCIGSYLNLNKRWRAWDNCSGSWITSMRRAWCTCTNGLDASKPKKNHIILWERILSRIVRNNYKRGGQLGSNKNRESVLPGYNSIASRPHQKPASRKTKKLEDAVRCGAVRWGPWDRSKASCAQGSTRKMHI
jgi:hypothetical protein